MKEDESSLYGEEMLSRRIEVSLEAQSFLDSKLGRSLVERARRERFEALTALAETDPADLNAIRALQIKARSPLLAVQWIEDAITDGKLAYNELAAGLDEEQAEEFRDMDPGIEENTID